jgi:pantoate--beta-alanine ligase
MRPPFETIEPVREAVHHARGRGLSVGLVPTMGALHAGHAALLRAARAGTDFVVVSIFVNPLQFRAGEDLDRYPRPLQQDLALCAAEGADLVFAPAVQTIYPPGFRTFVEVQDLQDRWEGVSRPGHFRGVATVVLKLLNIVQPDVVYFGQKDAQQVRIIQQLVRDLDVPVQIHVCPTVREPDGLALSSRNQYLDPSQRQHATGLYRALEEGRRRIEAGERDATAVKRAIAALLDSTPGASVDYVAVVDADCLQPVDHVEGSMLLAVAVRFGSTRLIDNVKVQAPG